MNCYKEYQVEWKDIIETVVRELVLLVFIL